MEKEKGNRKKIITYLTILVVVLILGTVTATYAFFEATTNSESIAKTTIVGKTDCIDITFNTDSNRVGLNLDYPVTDAYAMQKVQPIEVSIKNNCEVGQDAINYTLTLSTFAKIDEAYMSDSQIRTHIDSANPYSSATDYQTFKDTQYLDEIYRVDSENGYNKKLLEEHFKELNLEKFDYNSYDTITNYVIDTSSVTSKSENRYKIYLWVDYYEGDKNAYKEGSTHDESYDNKTKNHKFESLVSLIVNNKEEGVEPPKPVLAAEYIKKNSKQGLSEDITGGMYRFQGEQGSVDNYLCFGTKCENESEEMYRIIGVTSDGLIKVIKQKSIGNMEWDNDWDSDIKWPESDLYNYLNTDGNGFYNTLAEKIKSKIQEYDWKYGDIQNDEDANTIGTEIYEIENAWDTAITAPIGLMYIHDYYLAFNNNANCYIDNDISGCENNWIYRENNGETIILEINESEWLMTRYGLSIDQWGGKSYWAWSVSYETVSTANMDYESALVRPVFYLKSDSIITEGDGTPENPFILSAN